MRSGAARSADSIKYHTAILILNAQWLKKDDVT